MTTETRSLHKKLAQVMYEADRIPKNGTAPAAMGGFRFVQVGDAADVIRKALAEQKISMIPTAIEVVGETEHPTSSGKMMTTLTVRTTWTLTDGDSGESIVIQSLGSGADMGDKAAPKAQSNAMKYALLMGFLLSTGDDPEQADTSDRQARTHTGHRDGNPGAAVRPQNHPSAPAAAKVAPPTGDGGLIGTAIAQGTADFELRQGPDGWTLPFRVKEGGKSFIVLAHDGLAEALASIKRTVLDQRVTVWGHWGDVVIANKATYQVLHLDRIQTPDGMLPAPSMPEFPDDLGLPAPPDDVPLAGEKATAA